MIFKSANFYFWLAIVGYFGLFTLLMLWHTLLSPAEKFPVALVLLITVTPLLIPLRGLLNGNKKSCAWAAYFSLLYFAHGSVEAFANPDPEETMYAYLEVLFSLSLFIGAMFYVRFEKLTHPQ
jgi:uncharacterized membrane protein